MNMQRIAAMALLITNWAMPVSAQDNEYDSGTELLARCETMPTSATQGVCIGQIVGAMNALEFAQAIGAPHMICRPAGATNREGLEVVQVWLRDNPARRRLESTSVIVLALSEAWPCAGGPIKIDPQTGAVLLPRE
jgi:hypothetical protein